MRGCHRLNAAVERSHEVPHGAAVLQCLTGDGADGREHVLNAMVELSNQYPLVLLCPLTISDVDIDTHHPLRAAVTAVKNKTARFDPPNVAPRPSDTIVRTILFH